MLVTDLESNIAMRMTNRDMAYSFHIVCSPFIARFDPVLNSP
jgi:hypothetical protein